MNKVDELFTNPRIALVIVVNVRDYSVVLRKSRAPNAGPLPPQSVVDVYVSLISLSAQPFEPTSFADGEEEGWVVAQYFTKLWEVAAYRLGSQEGSGGAGDRWLMVCFADVQKPSGTGTVETPMKV